MLGLRKDRVKLSVNKNLHRSVSGGDGRGLSLSDPVYLDSGSDEAWLISERLL